MNQYDWQDTAPAGPRERRSSNILRLLTWFWTASASQISMRARSFEGMLGCETNAFPAKNTCFSGDRGSVVDSAIYNTSSAQSQSCSEGTSAQQAAKRVPSQIQTAKSGVVLPICRHNSQCPILRRWRLFPRVSQWQPMFSSSAPKSTLIPPLSANSPARSQCAR